MPHQFDTEDFVDYALRSNIMLQYLEEYLKTGSRRSKLWLKSYSKVGVKVLGRLNLMVKMASRTRNPHHIYFDTVAEDGELLFGGITINEFADPRFELLLVGRRFKALMGKLVERGEAAGHKFLIRRGFILEDYRGRRLDRLAHSRGRAIDLLIEGLTAAETFAALQELGTAEEFKLHFRQHKDWVHIHQHGKGGDFSKVIGAGSCYP